MLLAGGEGRRLGGDKLRVEIEGRPLAHYPLEALTAVLADVYVACRLDTELPALPGVREAWVEPDGPRGPVAGICSALREGRGRPVVACGVSLALITPRIVRILATQPSRGRPAVVPRVGNRLEPLIARWEPSALPLLAGLPGDIALDAAARMLDPVTVPFEADEPAFLRVEGPEDVLRAGIALQERRRAGVTAA